MTTLVGVKAGNGKGAVILGSDMSVISTRWNSEGNAAYISRIRKEGQKIYVDEKREVALCMSGIYDAKYKNILSRIIVGEINIKEAIERKKLQELTDLHLERWQGRNPDKDLTNWLLLSTRFGDPKLYHCFPLGLMEERDYTAVGSGSEYAFRYLAEQEKFIPKGISIADGIDLTIGAIDKASQDLYTSGLDLVVVTKDGIYDLGKDIRESTKHARLDAIEKVKRKF